MVQLGENKEYIEGETENCEQNAEDDDGNEPRLGSIGYAPADESRVGAAFEVGFCYDECWKQRRWVRCVGDGVQTGVAVLLSEVQLPR